MPWAVTAELRSGVMRRYGVTEYTEVYSKERDALAIAKQWQMEGVVVKDVIPGVTCFVPFDCCSHVEVKETA